MIGSWGINYVDRGLDRPIIESLLVKNKLIIICIDESFLGGIRSR